jgi:hypothetical protein
LDTKQLQVLIDSHGLSAQQKLLIDAVRPAITIQLAETGPGLAGQSRIGGLPDLPASLEWPRAAADTLMSFILQINLAELPTFAENSLPQCGMLYLFLDENDYTAHQLLVYTGDEPLMSRAVPPDVPFATDWYENLKPHQLSFALRPDLPCWASDDFYGLCEQLGPNGEDQLDEIGRALSAGSIGKLLGHVAGIGHDPRRDAYVVREVHPAWRFDSARLAEIDLSPAQYWQNLLMVDSIRAVDLMFGDAGYVQILIHENDLRQQDFSRVFVNLESS